MRNCLAALMLLTVMPVTKVLAAPAPERPYAILEIGPAPHPTEKTDEQYRKDYKKALNNIVMAGQVLLDPDVKKLPLIARMKDPYTWVEKNLRVTEEHGGRRLRLTFLSSNRTVQATILNAVLRANIAGHQANIKSAEEGLRMMEDGIVDLQERIDSGRQPEMDDTYRKGINTLRTKQIPEARAYITRLKQTAVIKWAK